MKPKRWSILEKHTLYTDRWVTLNRVKVCLPDGSHYDYTTLIRAPDAAVWATDGSSKYSSNKNSVFH